MIDFLFELFWILYGAAVSFVAAVLYQRLKLTREALNELALYFLLRGEKDTQRAIEEILHDVEEW